MSDLYWITVLGTLSAVGVYFLIVSTAMILICITIYAYTLNDENSTETKKFSFTMLKIGMLTFVVSLIFTVFIPGTKELYIIYGVGGTIDYLKQNPTAQKLPDKYIKLLDAWVDNKIEENKEK